MQSSRGQVGAPQTEAAEAAATSAAYSMNWLWVLLGLLVLLLVLGALAGLGYFLYKRYLAAPYQRVCTTAPLVGFQLVGTASEPVTINNDLECAATCSGYLGWNRNQNTNQCQCIAPPLTNVASGTNSGVADPNWHAGFLATTAPLTPQGTCGIAELTDQRLASSGASAPTVTATNLACATHCRDAQFPLWTRRKGPADSADVGNCYCLPDNKWDNPSMVYDTNWDSGSSDTIGVI